MTENPNGYIHTDQTGHIGWLTISNPDNRNAMNFSMYQMMPAAIKELTDADVRVIVIRGQGEEAFGAGSDISEFSNLRRKEMRVLTISQNWMPTRLSRMLPFQLLQ